MRIFRFFLVFICIVSLCSISVFAAPVILAQPQNIYLPPDVTYPYQASFSVLASGDDLTYQWQASYDHGSSWQDSTASGAQTNVVTVYFPAAQVNGGRMLRCIVSDQEESVISSVATVSVSAYIIDSLPQLLAWTNEVVRNIFNWVGDCCIRIVSEPILLFTVGFLALGASISIVSRLLSRS